MVLQLIGRKGTGGGLAPLESTFGNN